MKEENPVFAKCAARLVPFMVLLFTVNFLDRVNVGFAALTMNKDLGFSPATYGFGAGVFFVGYFAFQVPSNVMLARVGARRWVFLIVALWGAISAATALVQSATSFYVLRFLLGVAEAGLFPGMIYYLSLWFPHVYRARFAATIIAAAPLSVVLGGEKDLLVGGQGFFQRAHAGFPPHHEGGHHVGKDDHVADGHHGELLGFEFFLGLGVLR